MRWLFVTPDLPYPPDNGGRIRVYALLQSLSRLHEVHLLSFDRRPDEPDRVEHLQKFCATVTTVPTSSRQMLENKRWQQLRSLVSSRPYQYISNHSPIMQQAIDSSIERCRPDVVQIEFSQMGYYRLPGGVRTVLDQHNVESELLYRTYAATPWSLRKLYSFVEWRKFRRDEIRICRGFPLCLTTSSRDRDSLAAQAPTTRFAVIPNGVDNQYFGNGTKPGSSGNDILFVGTINYHPNTDGLLYFLREIFPLVQERVPTVKFWIVGLDPPREIVAYGANPAIEVTGRVDDVRDYYAKAAVVVVPLRIGGGTRLKILEALAAGRPVVSTSIGAEGIDVEHGKNILLADQPEEFCDAIVGLLQDPGRRARLSAEGVNLVSERYDWNSIAARMEQALLGYTSLIVKLHALDPLTDDRWPRLLRRHEDASVFHTRGWLVALRRTYGYEPVVYTTSEPGRELTAGIPLCRVDSRLTGRRLVSVPFADHCEPLATADSLADLLLAIGKTGLAGRAKYVEIRPGRPAPLQLPGFGPSGRYHLHRIDLTPDIETIRGRFHRSSVIRKIQRSEREGLQYRQGRSAELLDQFYGLFIQTRKNHMAPPPPRSWFINLIESLGQQIKICVALQGDRPVASIVICAERETHVYKYGCSDPRLTRLGGTAMLFDKAISAAKEQGARTFDMGRTDVDQDGLAVFKERWGAERSTLTYYRSPEPKSVPAAESNRLSHGVRRLISRLPDRLFVATGRILYRHLG